MLCELQRVSKVFGTGDNCVMPVSELDFSIEDGQYISIAGESGIGKSTLLFLISGLLRPTSGEIFYNGQSYGSMNDAQISALRAVHIGYIAQNVQLAQALTIEENLRLARTVALRFGADRKTLPDIEEIIVALGLEKKRDELPSRLSGGQKRRAMIAAAWARNPRLIVLDEPTNDLDEIWSERVMALIDDWHHAGKAILLVTHNPEYAHRSQLCMRMKNGKLSPWKQE